MRRSPPSKTALERGSRARGGETFPFGEEDTLLVSLLTTENELGTFRRKSVAPGNRKWRVTESSLGERRKGGGRGILVNLAGDFVRGRRGNTARTMRDAWTGSGGPACLAYSPFKDTFLCESNSLSLLSLPSFDLFFVIASCYLLSFPFPPPKFVFELEFHRFQPREGKV